MSCYDHVRVDNGLLTLRNEESRRHTPWRMRNDFKRLFLTGTAAIDMMISTMSPDANSPGRMLSSESAVMWDVDDLWFAYVFLFPSVIATYSTRLSLACSKI